jgi:hypothetical protein
MKAVRQRSRCFEYSSCLSQACLDKWSYFHEKSDDRKRRRTSSRTWVQGHEIVPCAPAVGEGELSAPFSRIRVAPLAHHVPNIPPGRIERSSHFRVNDFRVGACRLVAGVVFEEIDSPGRVRLSVLLLVPERACAILTGGSASIGVCSQPRSNAPSCCIRGSRQRR